uniref:Evasin P1180 n=1 Tax=Amblyomma triste TaxID=251400 RepID=E1180_AMBTT|nr:RecName: Full=Evasin P1180; Flags: Precursor [Amblyomma triste]
MARNWSFRVIFVSAMWCALLKFATLEEPKDGYDYTEGCPFVVLGNGTHAKPAGCSHLCNGAPETLDDNMECYNVTEEVAKRMTPDIPYTCWLGWCSKGECKRDNRTEVCYRGSERE